VLRTAAGLETTVLAGDVAGERGNAA
jgi:hypothetical protein